MKFTWITDIHLDLIGPDIRTAFYNAIIATDSDGVLLTGDVAEAPCVSDLLTEMAQHIKKPIYFVLGNHDYYKGKVDEVRQSIIDLMKTQHDLLWLPVLHEKLLTHDTVLVGQDGWADGRHGDYVNTQINLNDSRLIDDLFQKNIIGKYRLLEKMQELADRDAHSLHDDIMEAIKKYRPKKIIVLTHIPPFEEVCFSRGKKTSVHYLPYFASKATGDVLTEIADKHKNISFLVLCGHTHERAQYQALDNLLIKVGKAEYRQPTIEEVLMI